MIVEIRLEIKPRYGSSVGMVWLKQQDEEGKGNEEVVGSFILRNEEETALWTKIIENANQEVVQQALQQEKEW